MDSDSAQPLYPSPISSSVQSCSYVWSILLTLINAWICLVNRVIRSLGVIRMPLFYEASFSGLFNTNREPNLKMSNRVAKQEFALIAL